MTLSEYVNRKVPEYYHWMYLDGYTPEEIKHSHQQMMKQRFLDPKETEPEVIIPNITFKSVVKVQWVMTTKRKRKRNARRNSSLWWKRSFFRWWKRVWKQQWIQSWTNCSKTGNKKKRKSVWPNLFSQLRGSVKRAFAFFRYVSWDGVLFHCAEDSHQNRFLK